jgi:hypothetical protein
MAFANLKSLLRAKANRTIDALWHAIGKICDLFSPETTSSQQVTDSHDNPTL